MRARSTGGSISKTPGRPCRGVGAFRSIGVKKKQRSPLTEIERCFLQHVLYSMTDRAGESGSNVKS